MKKALYLTLIGSFGASISGVIGLLRALLLPEQELTLYLLGVTGGAVALAFISLAALRFPGPDLHLIYRRQFTARPSGAFLLGAVFGLGIGLPRIDPQDFIFDAIFSLWFALAMGAIAAVWVAFRRPAPDLN
ncbi:hypothetical protein [Rothia nasimurium]|uniref:hypothetical protein n=1 Tax=Rothia nasimurium TaxID=85336 RepID=UPI001F20E74F|nr:hypothetical protein [Rothia nasimurium]